MGQHRKDVVVLDSLGDRTIMHDSKVILIASEVAAIKEAYKGLPEGHVQLWDLPHYICQDLKDRGKLSCGTVEYDVEQALLYLDSQGEITLPPAPVGEFEGKHAPATV